MRSSGRSSTRPGESARPRPERTGRPSRSESRALGEEGQATVEFALCLPIIALALALVVQAAILVRTQLLLVEAAREGARASARDPRPDIARSAASAVPGVDADRLEVVLERSDGPDPTVTVSVRYRAATDVPLVGALLPEPALGAVVAMRIEPGAEP